MLAEHLLHRMQRAVGRGEALDRGDRGAVRLQRQHGAGLHRYAVDMHDAGAALAGVAADMGAGQPQLLAQQFHQQRAALDLDRMLLAVHRQGHLRHRAIPPLSPCAGVWPPQPRGGQAGAASAGTISVLAKSAPLKSRGTSRVFARAYEAQSPQFSRARMATLSESQECLTGDSREIRVVCNNLEVHVADQLVKRQPRHRITSAARQDHRRFLQAYRGHASGIGVGDRIGKSASIRLSAQDRYDRRTYRSRSAGSPSSS